MWRWGRDMHSKRLVGGSIRSLMRRSKTEGVNRKETPVWSVFHVSEGRGQALFPRSFL